MAVGCAPPAWREHCGTMKPEGYAHGLPFLKALVVRIANSADLSSWITPALRPGVLSPNAGKNGLVFFSRRTISDRPTSSGFPLERMKRMSPHRTRLGIRLGAILVVQFHSECIPFAVTTALSRRSES